MVYVPTYAPGKILVKFLDSGSDANFQMRFGETLGYTYLRDISDRVALFDVPVKKEKHAMEEFRKYNKFVEWTDLYDEKLDDRFNSIVELEGMVSNLDSVVESDDEFKSSLDEIIAYIKDMN